MNFDFTEKEFAFLAAVQEVFDEYAHQAGQNVSQPLTLILEKLAATDYLKIGLEKAEDVGPAVLVSAMESFAAAYPSLYLTVEMSQRVFGRLLATHGTDDQKQRFLAPLLAGQMVGGVALSEESMNIENEPYATKGEQQDGKVVVNGTKNFVVNASVANVLAVAGTMGDQAALFLVPADAAGLTVGEPVATLGYEGAMIATISLENVEIPQSDVIGPFDPKAINNELRLWENMVLIGACLGGQKASFEAAKAHAKTHKSGGKPIVAYQEVGFKLAEMLTMLQTSELLAMRAAWTWEAQPKNAADLVLCAKVFCSESAETVASEALQILSGAGYTVPNPAERAYRNAKYCQIAGTSTEISRVKLGDSALGWK